MQADDCLIVGGGVIGLSLAYELAGQGLRVRLLERDVPGREASWAGAGILPPANRATARDSFEALAGLSHELHPRWSAELKEQTGIDNGFWRCGGLYVARDAWAAPTMHDLAAEWRVRQLRVEEVAVDQLSRFEPAFVSAAQAQAAFAAAYLLPDEAQIRNPRHLAALALACAQRGVAIETGAQVDDFELSGGKLRGLRTAAGVRTAATYCLATGAWSAALLGRLGLRIMVKPIRGQIVLLRSRQPLLRRIVNEGPRYIVPRADGRVLVGSTQDDVGFDKRTTAEGVGGLLTFALGLLPGLAEATVETHWAGLRPSTADGLPYLGRVPGLDNTFVAAGHFRSGLQLSPATAVVMSQLIRGGTPEIDLTPFRLDRH